MEKSENQAGSKQVEEVIEYFKAQSKKQLHKDEEYPNLIASWLARGYTVEDCKRVIDIKCHEWLKDSNMYKWVRIKTLFGDKFPQYAEEPLPLEVKYRAYDFDFDL